MALPLCNSRLLILCLLVLVLAVALEAEGDCISGPCCGKDGQNATCEGNLCCSSASYCGPTSAYCGPGCQVGFGRCDSSAPPPPPPPPPRPPTPPGPPSPIASIITPKLFESLLPHRGDAACRGSFYTYDAFITAAGSFPQFGSEGTAEQRKRELAAFFGQTSHETTGGWPTAPGGPYAWGYCWVEEGGPNPPPASPYCDQSSTAWPCNPDKKYYGRGPIQLSWNYNYGQAGAQLNFDGLNDPDIVARDPVVSFKTAIWFWMTAQNPKPSCHDVILGKWIPSAADVAAGRKTGSYGTVTNIINGGLECGGHIKDDRVENRIGFFNRTCDLLGIDHGSDLDCYDQRPFGTQLSRPVQVI